MLHLFCALRRRWRLCLGAAHLNHGLRPNSGRDEAFVRKLCEKRGVPLKVASADIRALARRRKWSLEEAAREARYGFFESLGTGRGRVSIALAHTRDDQAETVCMRLLRGAGLRGLAAMGSQRPHGRVRIIRPLLQIGKTEILRALRKEHIPYRRDETNRSGDFLRNRVRRSLLPHLEKKYNPNFGQNLVDLAEDASRIYGWIRTAACRRFCVLARMRSGRVLLEASKLRKEHGPLRAEMLFLAVEKAKGSRRGMTRKHLRSCEGLLEGRNGAVLSLPGKVSVRRRGKDLSFGPV